MVRFLFFFFYYSFMQTINAKYNIKPNANSEKQFYPFKNQLITNETSSIIMCNDWMI